MHDDGDVCVGGTRVRVLVGTRAACSVALTVARPPSPSCLVGLAGVGVVGVGVAWVALGLDFLTTCCFIEVIKGLRLAGVTVWGDRRQCKN